MNYDIKNKIKNDKLDKLMFNKWNNNTLFEENTKPIVTKKNEYSTMSYQMWLGVKNYLENNSNYTDKINKNKKEKEKVNNGVKKNIKIYAINVLNKIFSYNKLKINKNEIYSHQIIF